MSEDQTKLENFITALGSQGDTWLKHPCTKKLLEALINEQEDLEKYNMGIRLNAEGVISSTETRGAWLFIENLISNINHQAEELYKPRQREE